MDVNLIGHLFYLHGDFISRMTFLVSLSSPTVMFADDKLVHDSSSPTSKSKLVQESLVQVCEWCRLWHPRTNAEKYKSMKFIKARDPAVCNTMANKQVEQVQAHKHLGVLLTEDLSVASQLLQGLT